MLKRLREDLHADEGFLDKAKDCSIKNEKNCKVNTSLSLVEAVEFREKIRAEGKDLF